MSICERLVEFGVSMFVKVGRRNWKKTAMFMGARCGSGKLRPAYYVHADIDSD